MCVFVMKEGRVMRNPMLDPATVRSALRTLGVKPTRAMGQNFLIDAGALATIVNAGDVDATTTVVEVGPGLGVLTWELIQRAHRVISVELDARLAERLRTVLAETPNLTVVHQDILQTDVAQVTGHVPYRVVANLPYAITSPVLRHFLEAAHPPTQMVVLVQREVAQRICAQAGDLSVLAHAIQIRAVPELVAIVPPQAFLPAPEVHSAVLKLTMRAEPLVPLVDEPWVMRIIKAGFLHARKQLGNSLAHGLMAHGIPLQRSDVQELLTTLAIDPMRRAETLTIAEWQRIATALLAHRPAPVAP
jgi:16S rRNA (adenine1518-N6/adenine1519-N6)-dimethyltransferase